MPESFEIWLLIGLLVGSAMGLTGAGGGMISVPLLVHLLGQDYYQATFFSLLAALASSIVNLYFQYRMVQPSLALGVGLSSIIFSTLLAPLKSALPESAIQGSFLAVCIFSALAMFFAPKRDSIGRGELGETTKFLFFGRILGAGILVGALVTLTGLGGGLILVPSLIWLFQLNSQKAVATTLLTIFLASIGSLVSQHQTFGFEFEWLSLLVMVVGIIGGARLVQSLSVRIPTRIELVRRVAFVLVVSGAVIGTLI